MPRTPRQSSRPSTTTSTRSVDLLSTSAAKKKIRPFYLGKSPHSGEEKFQSQQPCPTIIPVWVICTEYRTRLVPRRRRRMAAPGAAWQQVPRYNSRRLDQGSAPTRRGGAAPLSTSARNWIKALRPRGRGGAVEYQDYTVASLPDRVSAGGIRSGASKIEDRTCQGNLWCTPQTTNSRAQEPCTNTSTQVARSQWSVHAFSQADRHSHGVISARGLNRHRYTATGPG